MNKEESGGSLPAPRSGWLSLNDSRQNGLSSEIDGGHYQTHGTELGSVVKTVRLQQKFEVV
jgi:hypothetical protein